MRRPWLVKLEAITLAFVLLNGGGGMPLLDAALYHDHPVSLTAVRAGAGDAQRVHAQVCHLGWTVPHCTDLGTIALGLAVIAQLFRPPPVPSAETLRSADINGLPQQRAPPALLA